MAIEWKDSPHFTNMRAIKHPYFSLGFINGFNSSWLQKFTLGTKKYNDPFFYLLNNKAYVILHYVYYECYIIVCNGLYVPPKITFTKENMGFIFNQKNSPMLASGWQKWKILSLQTFLVLRMIIPIGSSPSLLAERGMSRSDRGRVQTIDTPTLGSGSIHYKISPNI